MKKQDILQFWRNVEIFNLPDLNKDAVLLNSGEALHWVQKTNTPKKYYKWRYTVIFGKIEKQCIINHVNTLLLADAPSSWEEPVQGFSCFSALILDDEGRPQQDSYFTASYTFGIQSLENKNELSSVSQDLANAKIDFTERYNIPQTSFEEDSDISSKGDVVNWVHLKREIDYLKQFTSWWKDEIKVFLLTEEVPIDSELNSGFLNSFYLDDLNHLSRIDEKDISTTLLQYLTLQPPKEERKDLIQNKQFLFDTINPRLIPSGRWPSEVKYGLYSAQAGAVNTIFSTLRNVEGIQGVNGPPGTGKTTLLLDVIAEIIVERAKLISKLGSHDIFQKGYTKIEKEKGFTLYTYSLNSSLQKNFGIVVASNNNAAVENISKELPLKEKIDKHTFPEANYFAECASRLIDKESWGIFAAALGNAKNRNTFKKAFWQSDKEKNIVGFQDLLYEVYKDEKSDEIHHQSFERHNKNFKSLLKDFEQFKETAASFHEQLPTYLQNKKQEADINIKLLQLERNLSILFQEKEKITHKEIHIKQDAERLQSVLHLHLQRQPSFFFFQKLFNTISYKKWNVAAEEIINNLKSISAHLIDLARSLDENNKKTLVLLSQKNEYKVIISQLNSFFVSYTKLEDELKQKYGISTKNLFNLEFYQKDVTTIHPLNPYHSPKIAKLRSDIFIASLQLHQDAILSNAKNFKNNLNAYFEMTSGWAKVDPAVAQNLWDTFFFCVPVVSTTLASVHRLFPNIDKEQIGWLLIDEAGQATPQSAAGLIHRAKRCVIVGDPLQVEPVVTMPEKLITKLRNEYSVPVDWSPSRVSVQQLADRLSIFGTYVKIDNEDEKMWTGFPLRTHRRCDDPMFSIANEIAYNNQMVKSIAIDAIASEEYLGASCWFDVSTDTTLINKHVVKEEVSILTNKINELRNAKYKGKIYVISPFKSVASYCDKKVGKQPDIFCGTIHTFQGKEADIVFLVLGSDPNSAGARNWASQKPNMLNVALTRAKKRFYVIGNKKLWASCNYFDTMAKGLD